MSRKIEIVVTGYGEEIVQGVFTDEEVEIIENEMEKNDESLEDVMFNDINSLIPEKFDWYECDDKLHLYGATTNSCNIKIIDGDKEIIIDNVWDLEDDPHYGVVESDEICTFNGEDNIITSISYEKGWIMYGSWEIQEEEELDLTKLKFITKDILFDNYEDSIITEIYYGDEIIMWDSDTTGKSVKSFLEKKE